MAEIIAPIVADLSHLRAQAIAAEESFAAVEAALLSPGVADSLNCSRTDFAMLFDDAGNLFSSEAVHNAAAGTGKLERLQIDPSDRYVVLVSAIAAERNEYSVRVAHGWPILSIGDVAAPTVAKAAGESIPGGGGAA